MIEVGIVKIPAATKVPLAPTMAHKARSYLCASCPNPPRRPESSQAKTRSLSACCNPVGVRVGSGTDREPFDPDERIFSPRFRLARLGSCLVL